MFYVGQKVICVNANNQRYPSLIKDMEYTVAALAMCGNVPCLVLEEIDIRDEFGGIVGHKEVRFVPSDILNNDSLLESLELNKLVK